MSRIAGVITQGVAPPAVIDGMVASQRLASWHAEQEVLGTAHFGWCGSGEVALYQAPDVLVALDGHIYNRAAFSSGLTTAQLVAQLYRERGAIAAATALNGDFAIAIFDARTATLWLVRDRFGVKPLYFSQTASGWAFASRSRALFAAGASRDIHPSFVGRYAGLHYRYFDADLTETPYLQIKQVAPATVVKIHGEKVSQEAYWSLTEAPDWNASSAHLAGRFRELLEDAVSVRVRAAVRPAFTLSGGLDSSSVLALAARHLPEKPVAFSTVYRDKTFDESAQIQPMLENVSSWQQVSVEGVEIIRVISDMVAANDEPVATATWLSHFVLCKAAADKGFQSLFGGLGGDELNAGEYEYFFYYFADLAATGETDFLDTEIDAWARHHDHPIWRKNQQTARDGLARLVDFNTPGRCIPDARRLTRYHEALNQEFFAAESFQPVMDAPFTSYLKNRTYQDLTRETIPCCLRANDRQTTAYDLDSFLPFLDYRLAEFMFRVPGKLKIRSGVTKRLLREAMRGILPEETRKRVAKMGWNAPAHLWFAGPGRELIADIIHSQRWRQRGIYNLAEVEKILASHDEIVQSGRAQENHMMFLWQLVNLELWFRSVEETTPARQPL